MRNVIAVIGLVIALGAVNWSIVGKEKHLAEGEVVYLELAPVDPRSLMQGDYMALRFYVADKVYEALPKKEEEPVWWASVDAPDGKVVVALDERKIGRFVRIDDGAVLLANELRMVYRVRRGRVKFATNAFFFEEGTGSIYEPALYGQFRVDDEGELLLIAMYDKDLNQLVPQ